MEHAVNNATNVLDMSHLLGYGKKSMFLLMRTLCQVRYKCCEGGWKSFHM